MTTSDPRIRADGNFLFEVDPKAAVFDHVRESVADTVVDEYAHLFAVDDVRAAFRLNRLVLDPAEWHVSGTVANGVEAGISLTVAADGDASDAVIAYVDDEVADRFPVDPARVKYEKIRLSPGAWFVTAVIEGV